MRKMKHIRQITEMSQTYLFCQSSCSLFFRRFQSFQQFLLLPEITISEHLSFADYLIRQ